MIKRFKKISALILVFSMVFSNLSNVQVYAEDNIENKEIINIIDEDKIDTEITTEEITTEEITNNSTEGAIDAGVILEEENKEDMTEIEVDGKESLGEGSKVETKVDKEEVSEEKNEIEEIEEVREESQDVIIEKVDSINEESNTYATRYESEPNNIMSKANTTYINDTIKGSLDTNNDVDWYKVTLPNDGELTVNFSHNKIVGDSNKYFRVLVIKENQTEDSRPNYIDFYSAGYDDSIIEKNRVTKGTYYIKVTNTNSNSWGYNNMQYSLSLSLKQGNYEKEFNDSMNKANEIKLNTSYVGALNTNNDVDYYKITIPNSGLTTINFEHANIAGDTNKYWKITCLNDTNYEYMSFYSYGNTATKSYKQGLYQGIYYIKVENTNSNSWGYNNMEYKLSVSFQETNSYELENNNTMESATKIDLGNKYSGYLDKVSDKDFYSFTLSKPTNVKLTFEHPIVGCSTRNYWTIQIVDSYNDSYLGFYSKGGQSKLEKEVTLREGTYYIKIDDSELYWTDYTDNSDAEYKVSLVDTGSDWQSSWAASEIRYAMNNNWINATDKFRPEEAITRAEFVKIVNKAFGFTKKASSEGFSDVNSSQWWYNEVLVAVNAGYIDAKQAKFRPNDKISREEVASIVTSIKKNKDTNLDKIKKFSDYGKISSWARSSVEGAVEAGYMGKGSTSFRPTANITRAESVVTLSRIVK